MKTIPMGGPAFAQPVTCTPMGDLLHTELSGMTLRDYFAAKALEGAVSGYISQSHNTASDYWSAKDITDYAYELADAMLEARKS